MPLQVRGTRERGQLLAAAPGKRCTLPLAQSRGTERGEQVAHVPVVIIATGLLKGVHIFEGDEGIAAVLAPVQAMYGARDIFRHGNIGGAERVGSFDKHAIDVEEDGIERCGKKERRCLFWTCAATAAARTCTARCSFLI